MSKQLNNLITPLLYRHIILNGRMIMSLVSNRRFLSPHKRQVALDVRKYTWNVTLRGDFPDENLGSVFRSSKHLASSLQFPRHRSNLTSRIMLLSRTPTQQPAITQRARYCGFEAVPKCFTLMTPTMMTKPSSRSFTSFPLLSMERSIPRAAEEDSFAHSRA